MPDPTTNSYIVEEDYLEYAAPGFVVADHAAFQRIMEEASHDVDALLGPIFMAIGVHSQLEPLPGIGALKYDMAKLLPFHQNKLRRAVCAQVEYRLLMGEDFFARAQFESASGPDFRTQGKLPYIGPKVRRELAGSGLIHPYGPGVP